MYWENAILVVDFAILLYFLALASWYGLLLCASLSEVIKMYQEDKYGNLDQIMQQSTIPITAIIPIFNEQRKVLNCLYSLLHNDYKNLRIILVNDGSTDDTLDILIKELLLVEVPPIIINQTLPTASIRHYYQSECYANIMMIDKEHGSGNNGADCHNAGLNATVTPVFMTLDADTVLEPDAITNILYHYLSHQHCIAVGGAINILNGNPVDRGCLLTRSMPKKIIPALQCLEYFRSFTYGRAGLNHISGALCYPGAFTLFETKAAKEFGGFDASNYSYDAEIIIKFHHKMRQLKYPTHVRFIANATAWTTVPETLRSFWIQRNRWQRGMLLSAYKHKTMFFNPKYGIVGLVSFPAYIIFEIFGPVVEFCAYILLGVNLIANLVSWQVVGWCIMLAWSYIMLINTATYYISMTTFHAFHRFLWLGIIEMVGFRQFRAACCFWGTLQFIFNRLRSSPL